MADYTSMHRQYTYTELSRAKDRRVKQIDEFIKKAILLARKYSDVNLLTPSVNSWNNKADAEFIDYRDEEKAFHQGWENEREHPLDRVIINEFNRKNDTAIENVKIVYGPGSDEYTRNRHALALTIANAIYFRGGKYRPETEEGRALLAHELTHVAQNKNRALTDNRTKSELEAEAEAKERGEIYSSDKELTIRVHGKLMRFPQSQKQRIADSIAKDIVAAAEQAENGMEEEKYLRYLCRFKEKVERGDTRWLE